MDCVPVLEFRTILDDSVNLVIKRISYSLFNYVAILFVMSQG